MSMKGGFRHRSAHKNAHAKDLFKSQQAKILARLEKFTEGCAERAMRKQEATPVCKIDFANVSRFYRVNIKRAQKIAARVGGTVTRVYAVGEKQFDYAMEEHRVDLMNWRVANNLVQL